MFVRQSVSKDLQRLARVLGVVGFFDSMMKMDLDLAHSFGLKFAQLFYRPIVILFGWKEIGVTKRNAIMVPKRTPRSKGQSAPTVDGANGFLPDTRLKMVGDYENDVSRTILTATGKQTFTGAPEWISE